MFLNHRGKAAAFAAAQHVLPPCKLLCMDGLAGGAHTSGAASTYRGGFGVVLL
jgi:hypothetical protein